MDRPEKKSDVSAAQRAHGKEMWKKNRVKMAIGVLQALPIHEREEVIRTVQCSLLKPPHDSKKSHEKKSKAAMSPVKKSYKK